MDEPKSKTPSGDDAPDNDATVIIGRTEEDDATRTVSAPPGRMPSPPTARTPPGPAPGPVSAPPGPAPGTQTVSAPPGPAPGAPTVRAPLGPTPGTPPPGETVVSGGGTPLAPRATGDAERRPAATPPTDDATVTRTVAARPAAPPKMPAAPPAPPPVAPPSAAASGDGPATRTIASPPQPPKLDRLGAQGGAGTSPAKSSSPPRAVPDASTIANAPRIADEPDLGDDATVIRRAPVGRPRLIVTSPDGGTREVPLMAADVSIGRAKTCDVVLASAEVSRLHARVVLRGPNHVLVPVGTHRNTFVNGELALEERLLRHGDVIRLATEEVVYAETEQVSARAGAQPAPPVAASAFLFAIVGGLAAVAIAAGVWFTWNARPPQPPQSGSAAPAAQPRNVAPAGGQAGGVVSPPQAAVVPPAAPAPPVVAPAVNAPPPVDPRADQVSKLVYQGDIAFVEKKYTTPPDGSALYSYREALKLDPQNARARNQIGLIVERYLELADRALDMNDRASARLYTDKAAYVHQEVDDVGDRAEIERHLEALGKRLGTSHR